MSESKKLGRDKGCKRGPKPDRLRIDDVDEALDRLLGVSGDEADDGGEPLVQPDVEA